MSTHDLPPLVARYLAHALSAPELRVGQVCVTQAGEMVMRPGGRALRFTAVERFAVDRVAFCWRARFGIMPLVSLRVVDGYTRGSGVLCVRALGLPIQRQSGRAVAVGEAYRYLAELPWVPYALATNHELRWRELDAHAVEVSTTVDDERPAVRIEFDDAGDVTRCSAPARPRADDGRPVPTAWGGEFSDYATLGGLRMPTRAEVYWELPEGRFVYWRGEITSAQALRASFPEDACRGSLQARQATGAGAR